MLKRILNNDYLLNLINKVFIIITGLLSSIFLTRYLGLVDRGNFSYIIQLVGVTTIFVNLGIPQSYSFYYRNNRGNVYSKFLNIFSLQSIILITVFFLYWFLSGQNLINLYILFLLPFSAINQQMASVMAVENIRLQIKTHMITSTFKVLAYGYMFFFLDSSLFTPILITTIIYAFTIFVYILKGNHIPNPFKINAKELLSILNYSWVPMLTQILVSLNYSIDIILLRHLGSDIELGLYSTAIGIINYFWLIPDSFKEVLVSRVARKSSENSILLSIKLSVLSILVVIGVFAIFGRKALFILYGQEFIPAYLPILILAFGAISMVFYKIIGVTLLAEGKRWFYFFSLLSSVLINIVLSILTIPKYGMYGASIATVFSYTICGLFFLIYYIKIKKLKIKDLLFLTKNDFTIFFNILKGERNV